MHKHIVPKPNPPRHDTPARDSSVPDFSVLAAMPQQVLQLQRSVGNQRTQQLVQRQPRRRSDTPLSRQQFQQQIQQRYGVTQVVTGQFSDLLSHLQAQGMQGNGGLDPAAFRPYDPGATSVLYQQILDGMNTFTQAMGGVGGIRRIVFFPLHYEYDRRQQRAVSNTQTGASYGDGTLYVYPFIITSPAVPVGRSVGGPPVQMQQPTMQQEVTRNVVHELAHDLVETALTPPPAGGSAPYPTLLDEYKGAVGWLPNGGALYDANNPAVSPLLPLTSRPLGHTPITSQNWDDARWHEQPISAYMTERPSEDFPEAVRAYITTPDVLRDRSPARYRFLQQRWARLRQLVQMAQARRQGAAHP